MAGSIARGDSLPRSRGSSTAADHFLSFDAPEDVIPRVVEFVDRLPARLPS
jgi:hypothetical protein